MPAAAENNQVPFWLILLLLLGGGLLMLLALGVIHSEPSQMHAPRWVVFDGGFLFFSLGILLLMVPTRYRYPASYLFVGSVMCSAFFALALWAALFATGVTASVGPFQIVGPVADRLGHLLFGLGALLLGVLTLHSWRQWWRALHGRPVDLT